MRLWMTLSLCLLAGQLWADELDVLPADAKNPPRNLLRNYLHAELQKYFDARREEVNKLRTPPEIHKRQQRLRQRFIAALGGFPERTPLAAQVVGKIEGKGYTIEKVIYQSRPQHHITANFYLPSGKGPFPGVLMPIGHSSNGKAAEYIQRGAILLAKNGIAVLAYDPIGQGERRQLLEEGKPLLPSSTSEHTMVMVGGLLVGRNTASYRVWDGLRSLDYLASRAEVDAKRLGCTGCSGGGTMTSYLMALDERILAAAPSCYITTLERLFATIGPQDGEQNIPGQVAFGMEHADYLTMRAPRPTLICAATRDFFDIQGTWTSFREGKRIYGLLGHAERIDLMESDSSHGFPRPQREAMLRFMQRWLSDRDTAGVEEDGPILKDAELHCTRSGQVLEDLSGVSVFALNAQRETELAQKRQQKRSREELVKQVTQRLRVSLPVKAATRREVGVITREGYTIRKSVFETEPGVLVPALMFSRDKGERDPLVLYVHGDGKAAEAAAGGAIEKRVLAGQRVLALDLRGLGETSPGTKPAGWTEMFGLETRETFLSLHLDRPLLGQRVKDVLAVVAALGKEDGLQLVGIGKAGPAALHAAFLEERIRDLTLERSLANWASVVRTPLSRDQFANVVTGVLEDYDLPDLVAQMAGRKVRIRQAAKAAGKVE